MLLLPSVCFLVIVCCVFFACIYGYGDLWFLLFFCVFLLIFRLFGEVSVFLFFLFVDNNAGGGVFVVSDLFDDCLLCFFAFAFI